MGRFGYVTLYVARKRGRVLSTYRLRANRLASAGSSSGLPREKAVGGMNVLPRFLAVNSFQ